MVFTKGKSGNPKGAAAGKGRSKRGTGTWRKSILWAFDHMEDEPGKEGKAPSGAAMAMLREARENRSKFFDRVEKILNVGKEKASAGKEEAVSPQDVRYGEVIDQLLEEFENGTMGGGGTPRPGTKPEVQAARPG